MSTKWDQIFNDYLTEGKHETGLQAMEKLAQTWHCPRCGTLMHIVTGRDNKQRTVYRIRCTESSGHYTTRWHSTETGPLTDITDDFQLTAAEKHSRYHA